MIWGSNLTMGLGSKIYDHETLIDVHIGSLVLGNNVRILDGVKIWTHKHTLIPFSEEETPTKLTIGDNTVICAYSMILPGCTKIAENVIIGAGSVVAKDILEPGTYAGNPVRKIK